MTLSPIVLFVYNRPWHTKQTVEALQENELAIESELFIYSDGANDRFARQGVAEVRKYIRLIKGFKKITIIEREKNYGLANSIINGVTNVLENYDRVIVLEDDIVTNPSFLYFMNKSLNFYNKYENVWNITAFSYPADFSKCKFDTYLYTRPSSKGWATWRKSWSTIDFDLNNIIEKKGISNIRKELCNHGGDLVPMLNNQINKSINSWGIRYSIAQIMSKNFTVYPVCSYVKDVGFSEGFHASGDLPHKVRTCQNTEFNFAIKEDFHASRKHHLYLKKYIVKAKWFSRKAKLRRLFKWPIV
jgi:hypothetical protein